MYDGTLGERVARLRVAKKVTQEELAFRAGVSSKTIKDIEGDKADPKVGTVKRIAKVSDNPLVLAHRLTHVLEAQYRT